MLGFVAGGFFAVVAIVAVLVQGPGFIERSGSLGGVIGFYLVGGFVSGTVVGVLLPITVWRLGAAFTGMVAAVPLYVGAGFWFGNPDLSVDLALAAIIGGAIGLGWWSPVNGGPEEMQAE